jgi:hypothetical protein
MAVRWPHDDHRTVSGILEQHPPESGRCADAARAILPLAIALDPRSRACIIRPTQGRFVATKLPAGHRWRHHVSVSVTAHFVDALTGPDGTEQDLGDVSL